MIQKFHFWVFSTQEKKKKTLTNPKKYMHTKVHWSIISNSQYMKATEVNG